MQWMGRSSSLAVAVLPIRRDAAAWSTVLYDMALDFHRANDDFVVYTYEDFIAGRCAAIENYLDITLASGEADVTSQYGHVVRTKTANDWRNWFTADDVAYFRPRLAAFMRAYGCRRLGACRRTAYQSCTWLGIRSAQHRDSKPRGDINAIRRNP
jgi:hypothetical protein